MPATKIFTRFTNPDAQGEGTLVYSAEKWCKIVLILETAGPVSVGTSAELYPVVSGKGLLLPPDQPVEFTLAKGDRLYMVSNAIDRVSVVIEEIPWAELILTQMIGGLQGIVGAIASLAGASAAKIKSKSNSPYCP